MIDPLRHDEPAPGADGRDSRIEELLLAGLDHYFTGEYELAISIWTRVLFLDRTHARARAYIERARSAVAERQREGEELLQTGTAAFQRGDAAEARTLLNSAVDRGASPDEARALLDRLDRLRVPDEGVPPAAPRTGQPASDSGDGTRRGISVVTLVLVLAIGLAAGASVMIYLDAAGVPWRIDTLRPVTKTTPREDPLPVPSPSAVALARAQALRSQGRLHQALDALDAVRAGDPLVSQADDLRTAIQNQLLAEVNTTESPAPPSGAR
jgi:tetratricopeptide (TPR) repeat protein